MAYHPAGFREKDVSTRLIKPTLPDIYAEQVLQLVAHWDPNWEVDGGIVIYDEGIAQYMLTDMHSHLKFYASLIMGKPSLRCRLTPNEPDDALDNDAGNTFNVYYSNSMTPEGAKQIEYLKQILSRRGYRFPN